MFKKEIKTSSLNKPKNSEIKYTFKKIKPKRKIKQKLKESFPENEKEIEELFPKNDLSIIKLANSSSMLYEINSEPLFYDLHGKGTQLAPTRFQI
jgi:hypothetical protein